MRSNCILVRLGSRPRTISSPSSSDSLIVGAILSSRALAALILLDAFVSPSFSLRFLSLRLNLRSSFSIKRAHQPASESQRCERTFSMTKSMLTPALLIRCSVSFSRSVEKGAGCCSFNIACWCGACSDNHGLVRTSEREGRSSGRFDSRELIRSLAPCGIVWGYLGSSFSMRILVSFSSSSSKGNSPHRRAYKIMPRLHTSTLSPAYFSPFSISGAL